MKQKKSPLKYFHQKLKSFRKSHNMWSVIIISYMHYFFFHFQPTMADKYSKYRSFFGISFNVLRMAVCFVWWHFHVSKHCLNLKWVGWREGLFYFFQKVLMVVVVFFRYTYTGLNNNRSQNPAGVAKTR